VTLPFVRDAYTRAGYACLAGWGWFIYGFGTALPLLRDEQQVSRTVISLHSIALAAGSLVSGAAAVPVVRRIGRRGCLMSGAGLLIAGTVLLVLAPSAAVSLPAALICGVGGSLMVNTVNASLTGHHGTAGAAAMSEGAALAAGSGVLAPLLIGACTSAGLTWRPAIAVVVGFALAAILLVRRLPAGIPALDFRPAAATGHRSRLPTAFWPLALVLVVCVGVEFTLTTWSPDLLRQRAGMSAGPASVGVTAIVAGMLVGRLLIGRLARRRSTGGLLMASLGVAAVGWLLTWTAVGPVQAMAGLALTGLGAAGQYPLAATLALDAAAELRDQGSGVLSIGIGTSAGAAPFALAALADRTSTHTAFLVVPALLLLAALLLATVVRPRITDRGDRRRRGDSAAVAG
jgi:MFS family permease